MDKKPHKKVQLDAVAFLTRCLQKCAALLFVGFFWVTVATSAAPLLEVLGISPSNTIQLRLHGQDSNSYQVVLSTNLTSWDPWLSLTTSNGVALFNHDVAAANALFFKVITNEVIQLQSSAILSVESLVTADGGVAELITPDFRHITLSIPPGCVVDPQPFTMTLVTNIVEFPFSQGTFGAVVLEPEDFTLLGAASLVIDFPADTDTRQVVSFSANNDGSTFHLVLDRIMTNTVVIPVTRFATYGSGLATPSELNAYLNPASPQDTTNPTPRGVQSQCASDPPTYSPTEALDFPPSCYQCFDPLVQRALAVRADLRQFSRCVVEKNLVETILPERQQQLLGQHEDDGSPTAIIQILTNICPIYQAKIAPLWAEAHNNCALTIVLLQFMLGYERQVQVLGATVTGCSYALSNNVDNVCAKKLAHECLREIQECCNQGFKGPQKVVEAIAVAKNIELSALTLFSGTRPAGRSGDPDGHSIMRHQRVDWHNYRHRKGQPKLLHQFHRLHH